LAKSEGTAMIELEFVPSLQTILLFSVASLVLALTPGPDMALFLARTVTGGRSAGFAAMFGASSGLVVHALLAGLGLSALLAASETAFFILKIVGGLYLLWLAFQSLRVGSAFSVDKNSSQKQSLFSCYLTGLGINLTNPKVIVFFVTFLPQFIEPSDLHATSQLLFLGLFFLLIGIPANAIIILIAEQFTGFMQSSPKVRRMFDFGFAGIVTAFAVKLVFTHGR
jgi:threonine/homoserine/homoserine lactone efflux protein